MKTKKLEKLVLNKATVANLSSHEMNAIHGGETLLSKCETRCHHICEPTQYNKSCHCVNSN